MDLLDRDAGPPRRRCLELVVEGSDSNIFAAPATHDLFDQKDDVALTHIYVPVTVDPPRDLESQRRFDEFWRPKSAALPEHAGLFLPLFPKMPLSEQKIVLAALLGAAALAALALWIGILVLLISPGGEASGVEAVGSSATE